MPQNHDREFLSVTEFDIVKIVTLFLEYIKQDIQIISLPIQENIERIKFFAIREKIPLEFLEREIKHIKEIGLTNYYIILTKTGLHEKVKSEYESYMRHLLIIELQNLIKNQLLFLKNENLVAVKKNIKKHINLTFGRFSNQMAAKFNSQVNSCNTQQLHIFYDKTCIKSKEENLILSSQEFKIYSNKYTEKQENKPIVSLPSFSQNTLLVSWENISFKENIIYIHYNSSINDETLNIKCHGIFNGLNSIKNEYFIRLHGSKKYSLTFLNSDFQKNESPDFDLMLDTLKFGQSYYDFKFNNKINFKLFADNVTKHNDLINQLYANVYSKNNYLKFLAQTQEKDFSIIPIKEVNRVQEDSILFRYYTKRNNILLIWENLNPARAAYVFLFRLEAQEEILKRIESFILSKDVDNKRSILTYESNEFSLIKKHLNFEKRIFHRNLEDFKKEVQTIIYSY